MSEQTIFSSVQAAQYLGLDFAMFRYYVYTSKALKPDYKIGHNIAFTLATLDAFKASNLAEGYTLKQAAQYLGVEMAVIRNHVFTTHRLTPVGRRGNKLILAKADLDNFRSSVLMKA